MAAPEVRVGLVGYGVMGKAHSYAYTVAPLIHTLGCKPRLRVISGRDREGVASAAAKFGFEEWTSDWRELVARRDIDLVDICTPPGTHAEIAIAAAKAGKAVLSEKPLAVGAAQAAEAVHAVREAHVLNAVSFNYRRLPALSLMQRMIAEGALGRVRLWRATWLTDEFVDPAIPFDWRFERSLGGSTIADLGSHLVDLALWMVGPITEVIGQSATFTPRRHDAATGQPRQVSVEEACSALLRFAGGATGVLEVTRTAVRRPCDMTLEVNGERGTLVFDYARLNELWYGDGADAPSLYGMRRIRAEEPSHPYAAQWWPLGQGVGYGASFVNQLAELLRHWPDGPWSPDFQQGLEVQRVCEAIEISAASRQWLRVEELPKA